MVSLITLIQAQCEPACNTQKFECYFFLPPFSLANKPKPTLTRSSNFDKMFPGESVTFTCKVDVSDGWVYLWYHYETQVQASSIGTYTIASIDHPHSGKYHCQAKRANGPFHTEESDTTALHVSGKFT